MQDVAANLDGKDQRMGIVVIGRNEGERLIRCLKSLQAAPAIVYVDSGSTDESVKAARELGADVVDLDMSIPFCAARARNEGFARLMRIAPETKYVQFVDGDCELTEGWLDLAMKRLANNSELSAVCGQLRERFPQASIYNHFCDLEWDEPLGITDSVGGIAMYRIEHFQAVGGFDNSVAAGEEPELCQRLRQRGWKVERLADHMGRHDVAMTRFGQWWRRQFRSGYNYMDVAERFGVGRSNKFTFSTRLWTVGPALALALFVIAGGLAFGWRGVIGGTILVAGLLLLQAFRIGLRGGGIVYGLMTLISKWGQLFGQMAYHRDQRQGRVGRLIEYKRSSAGMAA
ncbi:MAG TPA: glycosyltransferase [Tepidisphaeraceae bacterium]|jgi:GT2 family glycosyltransferase